MSKKPYTTTEGANSNPWHLSQPDGVWRQFQEPEETRNAILLEGEREVLCFDVVWRGYYPPPFIVLTDKGLTYTTASPGQVLGSLEDDAGERTLFGLYDMSSDGLIYRKCAFLDTYTAKKPRRRVLEL